MSCQNYHFIRLLRDGQICVLITCGNYTGWTDVKSVSIRLLLYLFTYILIPLMPLCDIILIRYKPI